MGPKGPSTRTDPALPGPSGQRPTWMVVLASMMAVVAFNLFLPGLSALADGPAQLAGVPADDSGLGAVSAQQAAERALRRGLALAFERVDRGALRLYASAKLLVAVLLLFAVAAIAANDRRGRTATLLAAWVAIGYHVAGALFFIFFVRGGLMSAASEWVREVEALGREAGAAAGSPEQVLRGANQILLVLPLGLAALGIAFSLLLITFFGGRRGRAYYGLPPRGAPEARPGA